jgi:hypothetical protein
MACRDARGKLGRERFAQREPRCFSFGVDRLGDGRESKPPAAEHARGESHDRGSERDSGPGAASPALRNAANLARGNLGKELPATRSLLAGK